ncbi:unnamed protein product [Clavelina lepadiformis]|uniref:Uncharacterized protein n=1 Tax=Clavelina lepadiformis TaxID=159417 RepID=A0ABP0FHN0_CLALP
MHSDILDVAPFNGYQEAWLPNDVDIVDEQVTYDPDDANYFNYYPEQAPVKALVKTSGAFISTTVNTNSTTAKKPGSFCRIRRASATERSGNVSGNSRCSALPRQPGFQIMEILWKGRSGMIQMMVPTTSTLTQNNHSKFEI